MMEKLFFRKCWGWQNIYLSIDYFHQYPERSWRLIKEDFYDFFGKAKPNAAHYALAGMEKIGLLHSIITQNIDNLHQHVGSKEVYEFHGNSRYLICESCSRSFLAENIDLSSLPPRCPYCKTVLNTITPVNMVYVRWFFSHFFLYEFLVFSLLRCWFINQAITSW